MFVRFHAGGLRSHVYLTEPSVPGSPLSRHCHCLSQELATPPCPPPPCPRASRPPSPCLPRGLPQLPPEVPISRVQLHWAESRQEVSGRRGRERNRAASPVFPSSWSSPGPGGTASGGQNLPQSQVWATCGDDGIGAEERAQVLKPRHCLCTRSHVCTHLQAHARLSQALPKVSHMPRDHGVSPRQPRRGT